MGEQKLEGKPKSGPQVAPKYLWHAGDLVEWEKATVHLTKMAWSAISAVFEGIRAYWNPASEQLYVFRLDDHLKRLFQSMKIMRMTSPYTKEELAQAIVELLRANECRSDTQILPLAYFGDDVSGWMAVTEGRGEIVITARQFPSGLDSAEVVHCNVSSWTRISDNVMPPRVKAVTNYQNSRLVSTESQINGYDLGIVLNPNGKMAEASYACLYLIRDGLAITPPVSAGNLESVTREVLKELMSKELGVPVVERDVDRTELYVADEVLVCGTAVEVQSVGSVDRYKVGDGKQGPVVTRLKELFRDVVRGADTRHSDWRSPVY